MFPDIIDKMIMFLKLAYGRCYFHSLLFIFVCFAILLLFSRNNKPISFSFLIGEIFHVILDLPDVPLFYPFIYYDFTYQGNPFPEWIHTLLTDPKAQTTEIIGGFILGFITINNKLYKINNIINYLKTNPNIIGLIKQETKVVLTEKNQ
jgi:hypothetical protein